MAERPQKTCSFRAIATALAENAFAGEQPQKARLPDAFACADILAVCFELLALENGSMAGRQKSARCHYCGTLGRNVWHDGFAGRKRHAGADRRSFGGGDSPANPDGCSNFGAYPNPTAYTNRNADCGSHGGTNCNADCGPYCNTYRRADGSSHSSSHGSAYAGAGSGHGGCIGRPVKHGIHCKQRQGQKIP